ncbi:MAG: hypothetical protein HYX48_07375 [Chlamydiales bacterium]|nr:hypothetical protein [Chlamydiales bacterium]
MTTLSVVSKSHADALYRYSLDSQPLEKLFKYTMKHLGDLPLAFTKQLLALCREQNNSATETRKKIQALLTTHCVDRKNVKIIRAALGRMISHPPAQARAPGPVFPQIAPQPQSTAPAALEAKSSVEPAAEAAKPSEVPKLPAVSGALQKEAQNLPSMAHTLGLRLQSRPFEIEATRRCISFFSIDDGSDYAAVSEFRAFAQKMASEKNQEIIFDLQHPQEAWVEHVVYHYVRLFDIANPRMLTPDTLIGSGLLQHVARFLNTLFNNTEYLELQAEVLMQSDISVDRSIYMCIKKMQDNVHNIPSHQRLKIVYEEVDKHSIPDLVDFMERLADSAVKKFGGRFSYEAHKAAREGLSSKHGKADKFRNFLEIAQKQMLEHVACLLVPDLRPAYTSERTLVVLIQRNVDSVLEAIHRRVSQLKLQQKDETSQVETKAESKDETKTTS